jgi:hypothetical protein
MKARRARSLIDHLDVEILETATRSDRSGGTAA